MNNKTFNITQFLNDFQLENIELVQKLKNTNHAYDKQTVNGYHIEDNLWTHIMMVLLQARNFSNNKINLISALFHDLGKAYSCNIIEDTKKVTFYGHEGLSTFLSIDLLEKMIVKEIITKSEAIDILYIINWHGMLFSYIKDTKLHKSKDLAKKFIHKSHMFEKYIAHVQNDMSGRFSINETTRFLLEDLFLDGSFKDIISEEEFLFDEKQAHYTNFVHVLSGLPGSGKNTWVKKNVIEDENTILISRDNIMLDYYKREILKTTDDVELHYSDIWHSLSSDKTNTHFKAIDKIYTKLFYSSIKERKNIYIDMTNLSMKSRRRWISSLPKKTYRRINTYFITSLEVINERVNSDSRIKEGKFISKKLILKFASAMFLPSYAEFDVINIKWDI